MRQLMVFAALAVAFFALVPALAEKPASFRLLYESADTAVAGVLESSTRAPNSAVRTDDLPVQPMEHADLYPCEISIRIEAILKNAGPPLTAGGTLHVISYLPSADCSPRYQRDETPLRRPALWLLRAKTGIFRTVVDNASAVFSLDRALSGLDGRNLARWTDPNVKVMYLLLKPGLVVPGSKYARSNLPLEMADLNQWSDFLNVYRLVYIESDHYDQDQISLLAASFGYCIASATRAADANGAIEEWTRIRPLLNKRTASEAEDLDLSGMSWTTKSELLAAFGSRTDAVNDLTYKACSSGTRVRSRARDLLLHYFDVSPSDLPCIPCD